MNDKLRTSCPVEESIDGWLEYNKITPDLSKCDYLDYEQRCTIACDSNYSRGVEMKEEETPVEWDQKEDILELDNWVRIEFNRDTISEYFSSAYRKCESLEDFQSTATTWAEEYIELFEKLIRKIETLEVEEDVE